MTWWRRPPETILPAAIASAHEPLQVRFSTRVCLSHPELPGNAYFAINALC
ncbi:hypothetical protein [Synechococcus sp. MIT S9504]|uniref:hypothetical protein n=1 Tax=Synechococcus sp. MIT S9504 TaxID=1801628 RepID=UPI0039C34271